MEEKKEGQLRRSLRQRHLTMIAIGGSIGTALFLSTGYALNQGGPGGIVLAYFIVAVLVFFVIMGLGEMATWLPCAGSFQTFTSKLVNPAFGFAVGWSYWFSWAVTVGIEIVASALIMKFWFPNVPGWIWSTIFIFIVLGLNLLSARAYGEAEFWFASIKVIAVVVFLIVGIALMAGALGGHTAVGFTNFSQAVGGIFPHGMGAVIGVTFTAVFCFLGTEIVSIAAGEGANPEIAVPKAVKTVFIRVVIFYIGATFMVAALIPWQEGTLDVSPFTFTFTKIGVPAAATIMNVVVLTSTMSCANSGLYASSRMLFSMAREGKAPALFGRVNQRGVPVPALLMTGAMGGFAFLTAFLPSDKVYLLLVAAASLAVLFAWIGAAWSHFNFRKYMAKEGKLDEIKFKAPLYPAGPIIAIIMCIGVIIGQFFDPTARQTAFIGVPLFIIVWIIGIVLQRQGKLTEPDVDAIRAQSQANQANQAH